MNEIHIYAPPGCYRIVKNNALLFCDLSGWYGNELIFERKKYERIPEFKKRCRIYAVKERRGKFMTFKQQMKIVIKNVSREIKWAKKQS